MAIVPMVLLIFILAAGCQNMGSPIDAGGVAKIERGVTTKDEVLSILGEPESKSIVGGVESWGYLDMNNNLAESLFRAATFRAPKVNQVSVTIMFDRDVVRDVRYSESRY